MNKTITVARANKNDFGLDSLEECGMHAISIVGEPAKHNMEHNKQHRPGKFGLDNTIYSYKAKGIVLYHVNCNMYGLCDVPSSCTNSLLLQYANLQRQLIVMMAFVQISSMWMHVTASC